MTEGPNQHYSGSARDAQRRGWTRSFLIALSVHVGIGFWLLSHAVPPPPTDVLPRIEPMLRAAIAHETRTVPEVRVTSASEPVSEGLASLEPSLSDIRGGLTGALSELAGSVDITEAYSKLADQAKILEQVSNPREVARIAGRISEAMGLQAWPEGPTSRPASATPFDFDKAMLLDITREERGDTVTIREVMGTRDGARVVIESTRRVTAAGPRFEQRLIEAGQSERDSPPALPMDAEDFAAVEIRQKPYELIRQFPLVQQLHHAAVLPLLEKLADESPDMGAPKP